VQGACEGAAVSRGQVTQQEQGVGMVHAEGGAGGTSKQGGEPSAEGAGRASRGCEEEPGPGGSGEHASKSAEHVE